VLRSRLSLNRLSISDNIGLALSRRCLTTGMKWHKAQWNAMRFIVAIEVLPPFHFNEWDPSAKLDQTSLLY